MRPELPLDLYRNIVSLFDIEIADELGALATLARTCQHMCFECQRLMFSRNDCIEWIASDKNDSIIRQYQFVRTVFGNPARFGGMVHKFVQVDDETSGFGHDWAPTRQRIRLWELTVKTLPYMTGLKILIIRTNLKLAAIYDFPTDWDVQLQTLEYETLSENDNFMNYVLPRQRGLRHVGPLNMHRSFPYMPNEQTLSVLESIECKMWVFNLIAQWAKITSLVVRDKIIDSANSAFMISSTDHSDCRSALQQLKYLRIPSTAQRRIEVMMEGNPLSLELLQLDVPPNEVRDIPVPSNVLLKLDIGAIKNEVNVILPKLFSKPFTLSLQYTNAILSQRKRSSTVKKLFRKRTQLTRIIFRFSLYDEIYVYTRSNSAKDCRGETVYRETPQMAEMYPALWYQFI